MTEILLVCALNLDSTHVCPIYGTRNMFFPDLKFGVNLLWCEFALVSDLSFMQAMYTKELRHLLQEFERRRIHRILNIN